MIEIVEESFRVEVVLLLGLRKAVPAQRASWGSGAAAAGASGATKRFSPSEPCEASRSLVLDVMFSGSSPRRIAQQGWHFLFQAAVWCELRAVLDPEGCSTESVGSRVEVVLLLGLRKAVPAQRASWGSGAAAAGASGATKRVHRLRTQRWFRGAGVVGLVKGAK
ncbi:hypothetical protein TcasGA2_TC031267 [Tribolium castaneum]|uniref:Uncharacterized protein n=1 Tax=Tribolium castaneum TaxID=7070 RepID=A0A139WDP9_TRICA|nr:hypothetical protein TcasGA2_TC031267 [Tribolium castaneum]